LVLADLALRRVRHTQQVPWASWPDKRHSRYSRWCSLAFSCRRRGKPASFESKTLRWAVQSACL
jgi:hypothetical protein